MAEEKLNLTPLTIEGLSALYPAMEADFPPSELKSLDKLRRLMAGGSWEGWLLEEQGEAKGYACFLNIPGEELALLDYYAIFPAFRGQGLGSRGLECLKAAYPRGFFLEAEDPAFAGNEEERRTRLRRVAFYQQAGLVPCPFPNSVFGVEYLVHLWCGQLPEDPSRRCAQLLSLAYRCQLTEDVFRKQIRIQVPET
jgi:GNAT superfamily N-acetyltransferase